MTLASRLVRAFSPIVIARGRVYAHQDRVGIDTVRGDGLRASVIGSAPEPYTVEMDWSRSRPSGEVGVHCTCRVFARDQSCKHIWAVVVEADSEGLGNNVPGQGTLRLTPLEPAAQSDGRAQPASNWKGALAEIERAQDLAAARLDGVPQEAVRRHLLYYVVDAEASRRYGRLVLDILQVKILRNGMPGTPRAATISQRDIAAVADPQERRILTLLLGLATQDTYGTWYLDHPTYSPGVRRFLVSPELWEIVLPRLCATGRLFLPGRGVLDTAASYEWDEGPAWRFGMRLERIEGGGGRRLTGALERDGESTDLAAPDLLLPSGCLFMHGRVAWFDSGDALEWVDLLRRRGSVIVRDRDQDAFFARLARLPRLPPVEWPEDVPWERVRCEPMPVLRLEAISKLGAAPESDGASPEPAPTQGARSKRLTPRLVPATSPYIRAQVVMDYAGDLVDPTSERGAIADVEHRRVLERDRQRELTYREGLAGAAAGAVLSTDDIWSFRIVRRELPRIVRLLLDAGWRVEAEGKRLLRPGRFQFSVSSGIDWFDLEASVDYGDASVGLPLILEALQRGDSLIELGDGTRGMLPEEWLERFAPLAQMATVEGVTLRWKPSQVALLDALLAAQESGSASADTTFERAREKLRAFEGVHAAEAGPEFHGALRDYQRLGLGWLRFLHDFGLGGCLADDMGLGKTVQVLALLGSRKADSPGGGRPSLVVAPRSVVHNWVDEARRFRPDLQVLDYTGLGRARRFDTISEQDVVITTYGTLRRDILKLRDIEFEYAILDEAQAIKNSLSQSAKAARLLRSRHRLALSGTPVENRLDDLWSIIEFLNPGMLGASGIFRRFASLPLEPSAQAGDAGAAGGPLELLARALRPYILRRTKDQVLTELPAKTEQTLQCEMDAKQRHLYVELRDHYRAVLSRRIEEDGLGRAKIQVLEALLRLRQAACHPGLLDRARAGEPSAKLDTLLDQLREIRAEGHKALVFSQFTRFLGIVKDRLDAEKITYSYLDGRTRDRKPRIARFQEDPECGLFLISLKAGGLGLNLTAADYVYILDPWWNPAVEMQAVDRAHRIGQARPVFVYRLLCRDTVEEKVLELQQHKRHLAQSILDQDASFLQTLSADDLRFLLG